MPQPDTPRNLEYLDDLPQGIFILCPDGTIAFWNHCLEEWTGLLKATIVGNPVKDHFPHLGTPKYTSRFELLFQGGPPATFASQFHPQFLPCLLPNGQRRIQQTIAKAIWDEPTQEWQALVIIQDISALHRQATESQGLRKQAQAEIAERKKHQRLLESIRKIESTFISTHNAHQAFDEVLDQLLAISESAYGFIGEVRYQDGKPYLKTQAITDIAWNEETRALYDRLAPNMEFCNLNTLFGKVLTTREYVISNDPQTDTRRGGLPEGHPALNAFLGIPIYHGGKFLGMAGLGNRAQGYDSQLIEHLQPLLASCGNILHAFRSEQEREQAQKALRESEDRFKSLINSGPILMWTCSPDGQYDFLNAQWVTYTGIPEADQLGDGWLLHIHPDDHEHTMKNWRHALQSGDFFHIRYRIRRHDGQYHWFLALANQVKNPQGQPLKWIGCSIDISAQMDAEEDKARLRHAIDQEIEGLGLLDQEGKYTYINRAQANIFGYNVDELLGQSWKTLYSTDQLAYIEETCFPQLRRSGNWQGELLGLRKDGTNVPIELALSLLKNQDSSSAGLVCTCRDITERKDAEAIITQTTQALEQQNHELASARDEALASARSKAAFLSSMSHEIRTPLNGVIGMTDLLSGTDLDVDQREMVETVKHSGEFLLTIIDDILDFSKMDAGKMSLEEIGFDVRTTVDEVVEILADRAKSKGLELISFIDATTPPELRGDQNRIRQILFNLIGNAIKFTEQGDVVVNVSVTEEPSESSRLRVSVRDTGIGLSSEAQDRIFESFTQADGSTTRKFGGTGLGLAICRQLVTLMNGEIGVTSQKGQGSTFWLTLPFIPESSPATATMPQSLLQGRRLCIVETHDIIRFLLQHYAESWGMVCEVAQNGRDGLALLHERARQGKPFDVAIVAQTLSKTIPEEGLSLGETIRQDPVLARIPLILLTSPGQRDGVQLAQDTGFTGYLSKPVRQQHLQQCLQRMLAGELSAWTSDDRHSRTLMPTPTVNEAQNLAHIQILLAEDNPVNQKVAVRMLNTLGYRVDIATNGLEAMEALGRTTYDLILMDCQMPEMDGLEATREIRRREALGVKREEKEEISPDA